MTTNKSADRATAQLALPIATPAQKVVAGTTHILAIKACPDLPNAPEVGAATAAWEIDNGKLAAANQRVRDLETALGQARGEEAACERRWSARADATASAITVHADGSKDAVRSYGMAVAGRKASPLETVPVNLRGVRSKQPGQATGAWQTRKGNHGFLVQTATNPEDPATHSEPFPWPKGRFVVSHLVPGSTLYLRVAACDARLPGKRTEYTAWVAVLVSA